MFTGIVEEVGTVRSVGPGRLVINAKKVTWGTNLGDSIAVNGCDLTAVYFDEDGFTANVIDETYRRTNLGDLKPGDAVNLERALTLAGRLGGAAREYVRRSFLITRHLGDYLALLASLTS